MSLVFPIAQLLLLAWQSPAYGECDCHATNARYNVLQQPKSGYDFIPIVPDDSLGFYVVYSAKQNETNTDFIGTSCIYVLRLADDEVLVFGGGYGDTSYLPGGAFFDADYDVAHVSEAIAGCMGLDPAAINVHFVAPHGHPDHITVAFIKALERAGMHVVEIVYQQGDRGWIEQLPWLPHHPPLFKVLPNAPCNQPLLSYTSPLGNLWFIHRPGHTDGSIDLVIDVLGDATNRVLVQGSTSGGCLEPDNINLRLAAHGTAQVGGPRRAQVEVLPGQGINRLCLSSKGAPRLGALWTAEIDVSQHPGATFVLVVGTDCLLDPGQVLGIGELIMNPLGRPLMAVAQPVTGPSETVSVPIPHDPTLMGLTIYAQGTILGGGAEMCNALRLVIGF